VVVIGAGFAGLFAARRLKRADVDVTVIDKTTHHLLQPLLYQVATGILSEGEIAPPTRDILHRQRNARVVLGEVTAIDLGKRTVTSGSPQRQLVTPYDSLIVAGGAVSSYSGHDEFARDAPGLKTVDDALEVRGRIFGAFEMAEIEDDPDAQAAWMTFVVVGAGATGVGLAGQIAELAPKTLRSNLRRIDPSQARVVLVGVHAAPLGRTLARADGIDLDRGGRIKVMPDCSLPGHAEVFVVGDMMSLNRLPGVAEVAMQSGRHAAAVIDRRVQGKSEARPFTYRDLGTLASISRSYAVAQRGRARLWGLPAWLLWLFVHLTFLTGFKNRVSTQFHWVISFIGRGRAERTITLQQIPARHSLQTPDDAAGPDADAAAAALAGGRRS